MTVSTAYIMKNLKNFNSYERTLEKINVLSFGDGNCLAELKVCEEHMNVFGVMHGAFSANLVDNVSSFGLLTHKFGKMPSASVQLHLTYLKAAKLGDIIEIDAKVLKVGKIIANLEVFIKNKATGELLVKGSNTKVFVQNTN